MCSDPLDEQPNALGNDVSSAQRGLQLSVKRLTDVVVSLVVLALAWPLFLLISILVKLSSPGPVFFVQDRVGKDEKPFRILKFRSMTVPSDRDEALNKRETDADRITPIGKLLRDYGLDELPQLLNILKGDMSLVGPRPPLPRHVRSYTERQRKAFQMRPGGFSLAGFRGRRTIPMEERIELHVQYVETWSLWLDWVIILRCIPVILRRRDVDECTSA